MAIEKYGVIRGRHRLRAAEMANVQKLRCNVHRAGGGLALELLPIGWLEIDEASQFDWSYNERRAKKMAKEWDERAVGVLDVTPLNGSGLDTEQRNALKLKMDRDQRPVKGIEHFLNEVGAGVPDALAIKQMVEAHGWELGISSKHGKPTTIAAVKTLKAIYNAGLLERTLVMLEIWKGEPKVATNWWLGGIARFCEDGYDQNLSENQLEHLREVVPAKVIKIATATVETISAGSGGSGFSNPMARNIAELLRKAARKRRTTPEVP